MPLTNLLTAIQPRLRAPFLIVLGSPRTVRDLADCLGDAPITCYQMDEYPAERLHEDLAATHREAQVRTSADLWDLPAEFATAILPATRGGERALKLDMVEQAFHVLRPGGILVVLSPYADDDLFPMLIKKVFGKAQVKSGADGTSVIGRRDGDRPRRRHEIVVGARADDASLRLVSRPGVFSYGKFDDGARALIDVMHIEAGDRILDLGCGYGANGIIAGRRAGPTGDVVFVDGNHRAIALAELNARANGLERFRTLPSCTLKELPKHSFDVALANPPYYAQNTIARLFIDRCSDLLKAGGRLYLVTKQTRAVDAMLRETFGAAEIEERRGYSVFAAIFGEV